MYNQHEKIASPPDMWKWLDTLVTRNIGRCIYVSERIFKRVYTIRYGLTQWMSPTIMYGTEVVLNGQQSVFTYGKEDAARVMFMVPGGGFVYDRTGTIDGSMNELVATNTDLFVVVCPYQIAPTTKFPDIHDQVRAGFDASYKRFAFQSKDLFVGGESTGGILTMDVVTHIQRTPSVLLAGVILWYITPQLTAVSLDSLKFQTLALCIYDYAYYVRSYSNTRMDINSPRFSPILCEYDEVPCLSFISQRDIFRHVQIEFGRRMASEVQLVDHRHGYISDIYACRQDFPTVNDFIHRCSIDAH